MFSQSSKSASPQSSARFASPQTNTVEGGSEASPLLRRSQFGYRPQAALSLQPKIETATWAQILASEQIPAVDATAACRSPNAPADGYYFILSRELELRLIQNGGGVVARFGGRKCHRKGQAIHMYSYGDAPDEPYVDDLGEYTVTDIAEFNWDKVSDRLSSSLGASRTGARGPYAETTLLRIVKKADAKKQDGVFPDAHFRYEILKEGSLGKLKDMPKLLVIDLREESQRAATPFEDALVVDFPVSGSPLKSEKFRWNVLIRELDQTKIKMSSVIDAVQKSDTLTRPILVVGNGAGDARPFWILRELSLLNFEKVFWYDGSAEKIKPYLK